MHSAPIAGGQDPRLSTQAAVNGIYQDPAGMKWRLATPGSAGPLGWAEAIELVGGCQSTMQDGRTFCWNLLRIPELRLSHYAHLAILEGLAPVWLFMGAKLQNLAGEEGDVQGPLMLLAMKAAAIHEVPFTLRTIALATGVQVPDGAKLTDLVPAMVGTLYNNRTEW